MDRYKSTKPAVDYHKRVRKFKTTMYTGIDRMDDDLFVRTRVGDRLDNLAHEFYGDVTLWWILADANALGKGSFAVPPGTKLRIPQNIPDILNKHAQLNFNRR